MASKTHTTQDLLLVGSSALVLGAAVGVAFSGHKLWLHKTKNTILQYYLKVLGADPSPEQRNSTSLWISSPGWTRVFNLFCQFINFHTITQPTLHFISLFALAAFNSNGIRTTGLPEDADPADMANYRLAIVLRADALQDAGGLVVSASRSILGQFKKLYKRKDPNLKLWEGGGQRIEVRIASSEGVLVAVQEAARGAGLPSHCFAGIHGQPKKRSVMVVGPAVKEKLWDVVGKLEEA